MLIKTKGLVLKQRSIGENDRMLTILTSNHGVMEVSARQVKRIKSPLAGATQVLCYSEFCIYCGKRYDTINSAEIIESFYELRLDVQKLSLAAYFCDLTSFISPPGESSWVYLRLLLNTLAMLEKDRRDQSLLKCIFELRMLSLAGFMPDLTCCKVCAEYENEVMYFLPVEATLLCGDCRRKTPGEYLRYTLNPPVLHAMRHIIYSDDDKLFRFGLKGDSLKQLSFITENYTLIQTDHKFKTLEFYKQML